MILDEIMANKAIELEAARARVSFAEIERIARQKSEPKPFSAALRGSRMRLIAEVKRASPSRGLISKDFDPVAVARTYANADAAAISVLTESKYFQGGLEILDSIGMALGGTRPPLLRKDFIFDPYQVYEARAHGADALLLIVAALEHSQLRQLASLSQTLGMGCLIEVHNEAEVDVALSSGATVIGINNRDLKTFNVDLSTTERLRPVIPGDLVVVSESGVKTTADVRRLRAAGVDAILVGEALMSAPDASAKIKELLA